MPAIHVRALPKSGQQRIDVLHAKLGDEIDIGRDRPSVESREVANEVVLDFDDDGVLVDIDHASRLLDLTTLEIESVPLPTSG